MNKFPDRTPNLHFPNSLYCSVCLLSSWRLSNCRIFKFFSFSVLMVFYRTKGFNVTAAIPSFMVDIERILVVKFKCCVWTAVCFLCTWMQDTSS